MTRLERWVVKMILAKDFVQGYYHDKNIEKAYALIREVVEEEFTEDNEPTIDSFLYQLFENTQNDGK